MSSLDGHCCSVGGAWMYQGVLFWNRYLLQAGCPFIIVTELETD